MKDFVEIRIIEAVRKMLSGRVNDVLREAQFEIPIIEFGDYEGGSVFVPEIALTTCERTEKERIVRLDAYSLTIAFNFPDKQESELYCYAYSAAVGKAVSDDPTLGGIADRAVIVSKKYTDFKESRGLVVTLRVTVETMNNEQGTMNNVKMGV